MHELRASKLVLTSGSTQTAEFEAASSPAAIAAAAEQTAERKARLVISAMGASAMKIHATVKTKALAATDEAMTSLSEAAVAAKPAPASANVVKVQAPEQPHQAVEADSGKGDTNKALAGVLDRIDKLIRGYTEGASKHSQFLKHFDKATSPTKLSSASSSGGILFMPTGGQRPKKY